MLRRETAALQCKNNGNIRLFTKFKCCLDEEVDRRSASKEYEVLIYTAMSNNFG